MYFKIIFGIFLVLQILGCEATSYKFKQDSAVIQQQRAQKGFEELDKETSQSQEIKNPAEPTVKPTETVVKNEQADKVSPNKITDKDLGKQVKYPFKDGRPVWFYDPFYDGYLGALGIARKGAAKGGYAGQKRLAKTLAQAELAKQIRVFVSTELNTTRTSVSTTSKDKVYENYKSTLSTISVHRAEEVVRGAVIQDEWSDESGNLYIWLVIEKE